MGQTNPLSLPVFNIEQPDLSKMNLAGYHDDPRIRDAIENAMAKQNEFAKALEKRYEQPNWFKVAAGFAKPQLGGFTASLGSAAEALGDTVEQQRMVAPTVAQMQMKTSVMEASLRQQELADKLMRNWEAMHPGEPYPPDIIAKVEKLTGATSPYSAAANKFLSATGTQQEQQIQGGKALAENPTLALSNPFFKNTAVKSSPEDAQKALNELNMARPKDMPLEKWNGLGTSAKLALVADYTKNVAMQGLDEEKTSEFAAKSANNLLNDLTYLRTLAVDPKLAPMFSLFKNGDALSMFRSYLDKFQGNVSAAVEGMVAAAGDQLKNADTETRLRADELIKGIARLEVNLRGSNVNPTNALQELNSMQSPSLANSQAGFVGILDQMGLQAKHDIDRHNLRIDSDIPAKKIYSNPTFETNYRRELQELARRNPLESNQLPSWYTPSNTAKQNNVSPPASKPASTPGGNTQYKPPAGWRKNPDGSFSKD
jgi:hypothetical protein